MGDVTQSARGSESDERDGRRELGASLSTPPRCTDRDEATIPNDEGESDAESNLMSPNSPMASTCSDSMSSPANTFNKMFRWVLALFELMSKADIKNSHANTSVGGEQGRVAKSIFRAKKQSKLLG